MGRNLVKKLILALITLTLGLYAADSSAQLFRLNVTNYGGLNASEQAILNQALREAEASINKDFPSTEDPKRLMQGMANSSVMAGKGIGNDYASNMDVVLVGAGVGVGVDLEKDKQTGSDLSGAGIQGGIILGTSLGWMNTPKILGLETKKLAIYVNYLGYNLDRKLGDANKDELKANLNSLGFHVRYNWISGMGSKFLGWGGIKVHTGYEYNKTKLTFTSSLSETINENVGGQTVSGTIQGSPSATIDVATQSIPFEISTDVQLLYILSLYTGLGVDLNFGKARGAGSLNANPTTLNYSGAGADPVVQADANINGSGSVDSFLTRGFAGVQVNLPYLRIFAQIDKAFGNELVGATGGIRFVY
jgi:hypothetical protein